MYKKNSIVSFAWADGAHLKTFCATNAMTSEITVVCLHN